MPSADLCIAIRWWGALFLVGAAAYPLTRQLFPFWHDRGYLFSKAIGIALIPWIVYVLGMARIAPFTVSTIFISVGVVFVLGLTLSSRSPGPPGSGEASRDLSGKRSGFWIRLDLARRVRPRMIIFVEELFFLAALLTWSFVKAHEPSIRGLEKFMDYGFMQSILNSRYFPPVDMWFPPYPINYYYFGHLVTALLTRLSGLDLSYTFNLMLAALFAFTFTMSFSIGRQLVRGITEGSPSLPSPPAGRAGLRRVKEIGGGILTAFLVSFAGNMQTIYAFTRGYTGDDVKPFWELGWKIRDLWAVGGIGEITEKLGEGMQTYWYANATRFIPYTIHEFPSYSFVVSDVHGHVLSIPFVLLAIALLITLFGFREDKVRKGNWGMYIFYGFLCGVLLMTNALDGPIYLGLFVVLFMIHYSLFIIQWRKYWKHVALSIGLVVGAATLTSLPFLFHFKSFVNGIAVNCPLPFLANTRLGPLLFEGVEKCQRSPIWMMWLLWGFFGWCGVALVVIKTLGVISAAWDRKRRLSEHIIAVWKTKVTQHEKVLLVFFAVSFFLIIFPEFFYFKDIYPQHFRSNTMFKLGYQAFILLSIVSGYTICLFLSGQKTSRTILPGRGIRLVFVLLLLPQMFLVSVYPMFSIRSYFGGLRQYEGLYGFTWLLREYPDDFAAIQWLKLTTDSDQHPVLVEADGDSYTDYQRFSVLTGIPTPVGWAVHEWLWRGSYDVVSPRREDVRMMFESGDIEETRKLLEKHGVRYIIVGTLERKKFTKLQEWKFSVLGSEAFRSNETVIYAL